MSGTDTPMNDSSGFSMPIQVVEAGPIRAWLAEDHSVPVVSVSWGWDGGAALDPAGAEGTAALAASLLTEGAGSLDALAFALTVLVAPLPLVTDGLDRQACV